MITRDGRMQGAKGLVRRVLTLCLMLVLLTSMFSLLPGACAAYAQDHALELTLTQTRPEGGFMMIPGAVIPQDIAVNLKRNTGSCYVYVRVTEKNNEADFLTYSMADGWQPLLMPDGAHVPDMYYRYHDQQAAASWAILADEQVVVNPETVTWPMLNRLAQDASGESWPSLAYEAYGFLLEEADGVIDAYDGWCLLHSDNWQVRHEEKTPDAAVVGALSAPDGLNVRAFDVSLQDENGSHMQPYGTVGVKLPAAEGAESALVLHVLESSSTIINAISAGSAVALQTGDGEMEIVEVIEAEVEDGYAVFDASGFSTYYVVSGHTETLKSWWQDSSGGTTEENTRFNVDRNIYGLDSSDTNTQTYYVEPDTTFYLYVKNGTAAERSITENTSGGTITLSTAVNDPAGLLVKVSGTAQAGQTMTFTVNNQWTIQIIVDGDVVDETFDNLDYPVYVGITFNPTTVSIANEPRVSGNDTNDWTYITDMSALTMTGSSSSYKQKDVIAPVDGSMATDYLLANIKDQNFLEGTDDDNVKGLIDTEMNTTDGYPPTVELDSYVHSIDWEGIADKLLQDSNISSKIKATDGVSPTMTKYGEVDGYVLQPYVVKLQTSKYVGWHINACFVPVRSADTQWMNFDENLPEGAYIDYLNVPLRKPLKTGSTDATTALMYSVQPGGTDYVAISESEYVTLSDGRKLRFIGWNTQSDGSGCQYPGQSATYTSPSNDSGYWAGKTHDHNDSDTRAKNPFLDGKTGTMYAFWSAIAERLELHKVVETDGAVSANDSFTFKLTITSLDGVQLSQDGGDKIVFELYDAATDTLVPNSKNNNTALALNATVEIRMPATQYAAIFLPTGTQYKIEETGIATNYTLIDSVNAEGIIGGKGNDGNVIFTNSYNSTKGFLNLEKNVIDEAKEADPDQLFTFGVTFDASKVPSGKTNDVEFTLYNELDEAVYDTSERVTVNTEGSIYNVLLKNGERIVFNGLEQGTTYSITETPVKDYTTAVTTQVGNDAGSTAPGFSATGEIVEDKFTNVMYTNTYVPPETNGLLTITKAFDGCTPEPGESFVFTVKDASGSEVAEVVIYGAGSKTLSVPFGDYTVTEDDAWSWKYSVKSINPSQTVTVSSTNNPTVIFTNEKSNGKWLEDSAGVTNKFRNNSATTHGGEQ